MVFFSRALVYMAQKVIKMDPSFLKVAKSKPETKAKKIKTKSKSLGEHKLRKKLMSRIHEFQARNEEESDTQGHDNNVATNDVKNEIQVFGNAFDQSVDFLKELAARQEKRKRNRETKKKKHKPNANGTIRVNTSSILQDSPHSKLIPETKSTSVLGEVSVLPPAPAPALPPASAVVAPPIAPPIAPPEPAAAHHAEIVTSQPLHQHNETLKNKPPPPYTCLKNSTSTKPTYREWMTRGHKTQDAKQRHHSASPNITIHNNSTLHEPSIRSTRLAEIKSEFVARKLPRKIRRKKMTTIKHKLGRSGRKVCVLIKNHNTRKQIKRECGELKHKKISEVRTYLKKHNLLKGGSVAPNEVLKATYEQAILAGDVVNKSYDTLLHNFNTNEGKTLV